jgi:hypothetical protein
LSLMAGLARRGRGEGRRWRRQSGPPRVHLRGQCLLRAIIPGQQALICGVHAGPVKGVSSLTLHTSTIPLLLYGCGEVTSRILKLDPDPSASLIVTRARLLAKFNSILMPGCTLGEKFQTKLCTIGRGVVLGDRVKLNNIAVMDGATIGLNTMLQQCLLGANARIGANYNLKDSQVGPGMLVPAGTRSTKKGEAFHA